MLAFMRGEGNINKLHNIRNLKFTLFYLIAANNSLIGALQNATYTTNHKRITIDTDLPWFHEFYNVIKDLSHLHMAL